nr:MAG TPA: hypothetical protein [Caudoviricetes sp.]
MACVTIGRLSGRLFLCLFGSILGRFWVWGDIRGDS